MIDKGIAAVEAVDECLGRVVQRVLEKNGAVLITADHGNSEQMIDPETHGPWTAHTLNPVPFILVDDQFHGAIREYGLLSDVAPTLLQLMGLPQPEEMTGTSMIKSQHRLSPLHDSFFPDE
jgi:2,3-bisphosphoglycerate-independent phosphoglycerate mutase